MAVRAPYFALLDLSANACNTEAALHKAADRRGLVIGDVVKIQYIRVCLAAVHAGVL
jgi:hypothetical protein